MSQPININNWIEQNQESFLPPVCNKLMHEKQLKVFFVGGPNQRKDFHLELGEELFYMKQGDMKLIILEKGKFKTVTIQEGEVFLLPGRIPHSPQRSKDTVGLVIERERSSKELDCLRYFIGETTDSLFERWFYCDDLGAQLVPVIKEYFASEEHRTGRPVPGSSVPETLPYEVDMVRVTQEPFNLKNWLRHHESEIQSNGVKTLFDTETYKSEVLIYGQGNTDIKPVHYEFWLWQLEGESTVTIGDKVFLLKQDDSILIPSNYAHSLSRKGDKCFLMSVAMPTPDFNE